jgi:hypothetical protein
VTEATFTDTGNPSARYPAGRMWRVVLLRPGDRYGRDNYLTADAPLVEFYDLEHAGQTFPDEGQFVSRYNLSAMLRKDQRFGLNLDGGVSVWRLSQGACVAVRDWLIIQVVVEFFYSAS